MTCAEKKKFSEYLSLTTNEYFSVSPPKSVTFVSYEAHPNLPRLAVEYFPFGAYLMKTVYSINVWNYPFTA